ncbi:MAG TPA: glycosyltransferase [Planctomycetota bacterium]|nr:glycosyltransferase [Planctomycetota bacterium]
MLYRPATTPSLPLPAALFELPVRSGPQAKPTGRTYVDGKFLAVDGERLFVRAVTYGSFASNDAGEPFPPFDRLRADFAQMRACGVNAVRLYTPPSDRIADAAADAGLWLIADLCWGPRSNELEDRGAVRSMVEHTRAHARRLRGHQAMLLWGIGNEIPPLITRWHGRVRVESFLRELAEAVKDEVPDALVTYCNHPPTEYLDLPFLDVASWNVYLHDDEAFRRYLARLQTLAGSRPLFLSELGLDSVRHGAGAQAQHLRRQIRAAIEHGLCGAAVYAWTDEWSIFDTAVNDWSFGVTDRDRRPKPALQEMQRAFARAADPLAERVWPSVSVVVASYNAAATLDECLQSLRALRYPDFEVIVVDDGSTDDTAAIARRHRVGLLEIPHGGLSRARNAGIEAARGEIIAFLDSDARADADWLRFLVTALESEQADAAGGPNLEPPEAGFVARCVGNAPGNPTHVLVGDTLAEHVAGCNMAFRRTALQALGGFDARHDAAGDDVDVCWRLLDRGSRIAFSSCALVLHHRRGTVRGFLRQQRGYGRAEAALRARHPGRFNVLGDPVWRGSIYGWHGGVLRRRGATAAFAKVQYGMFGGSAFQAVYPSFQGAWLQVFTRAGWQMLTGCILLAGVLGLADGGRGAGAALAATGSAMAAATLAAAFVPALHAVRERGWRGTGFAKGLLLILALHVLQPLARSLGRLTGWLRSRGSACEPMALCWSGGVGERHMWLERLATMLRERGWDARVGGDFDRDDLHVLGPGPFRAALRSSCEEDLPRGKRWIRAAVVARMKWWLVPLWLVLASLAAVCAIHPFTWPLELPLGYAMICLWSARASMCKALAVTAADGAAVMGLEDLGGAA